MDRIGAGSLNVECTFKEDIVYEERVSAIELVSVG